MTFPDLQIQARALGDPTRHRIFRRIAEAATPVTVAELTDELGLNHNAIRQHLAKLVAARLIVEDTGAPAGRGRPPLVYTVDPSASSRWDVTGPYERLATWLAEVVGSGAAPVEVGRRAGRRQLLAERPVADPLRELLDQMAQQGFDPTTTASGDVILHACPYESAALAQPDVVCGLHLGFAEGVAEQVGGLSIEGLRPNDPRRAGCRLMVSDRSAEGDAP